MMEKKNVPAIRFSEFTDEWEQRKFIKTFDTLVNNTLSRAELTDKTGIGRDVHYGDVLVKFGECLRDVTGLPFIADDRVVEKFISSSLRNGDVIIADTAEDETVGKCTEILDIQGETVLAGLHTIPCRPKENFAPAYLGYFMNSPAYHDQLRPLMQGIKVTSIAKSALQDTVLYIPKNQTEQAQIGQLFLNLDSLISSHQDRYEKLQSIKKAMLEKMFPHDGTSVPEVRFNGFTGEWTLTKMDDVVSPYLDPVPTPHDGYWRLGIRSHAKGVFHDYVRPGMELETAKMHRVAANNFIVNITFGWEHAVAITSEEDAGMLVSHRFPQFSFNQDMVPEFFKYVIADEKFRRHLELASPGGAGRNRVLNIPQMLEYKMYVPSKPEQERISGFFLELDNLITLQQQRLEKLKNIKSACLEGMFV